MRFVAGRRALAPLTGRWILDDRIGALQLCRRHGESQRLCSLPIVDQLGRPFDGCTSVGTGTNASMWSPELGVSVMQDLGEKLLCAL
jgi:hypothetical protein